MEPETKKPEEGGREDDLTIGKITQTFESSTAVITFSGTALGSDSDSLSSSDNDDDDDDTHNDIHRDSLSGKEEQRSAHSIKPASWKEESWKSDSGFNSDTPMSQQGYSKRECNHNIDKNTPASNHYSPTKSGTRLETTCTDNNSIPSSALSATIPEKKNNSFTTSSESISKETISITSSALSTTIPEEKHNSFTASSGSISKETISLEGSSPRSNGSERSQRFNPFNRVPFIEDDHFDTMSSFPSVSGTNFAGYKDDFGTPQHSTSSDTDTEVSLPSKDLDLALITNEDLGITEDHFSQPEGCFGFSKVEELEMAIELCKESVRETNEHTEQRRELINRLVQLRMKLLEIKEGTEEDPDIKQVLGHKFCKRKGKSSNHQCEMCNSVIWGMLQSWHKCLECGFSCHSKCLNFVKRQCASTKVKMLHTVTPDPHNTVKSDQITKRGYIMEICPESGLAAQNYRCAECRAQLSFKGDAVEPRQCDYDGHYYCSLCHWNDTEVIPARVIHNWDFETRKVCRQSKQFLKLMLRRSLLCIQDLNPMLFNYVEELSQIKKLREEILIMKMYFLSCRKAMEDKLLLQLQNRPHFVEQSDTYSLQDLIDTKDNTLLTTLSGIHSNYAVHIRIECPLCQARGFICELCNTDEILYPFDMIAAVCPLCSSVFHRDCFYKRDQECPKCERMNRRTSSASNR
ncbi:differentially expressed in FDCP 8 homolog B-like isoform X2 [Asterias rubens]|uniref:differentially expressed in FDCP 8 homolog B-like isoform X2 n=1 Tax=Asterias rubens TaxID=7604 RepID=UPI0014553350|nr:differentially expressed in FDCP 8 homolog B-like isoform X2 [Asterias rubens]